MHIARVKYRIMHNPRVLPTASRHMFQAAVSCGLSAHNCIDMLTPF